MVIFFTFFSFYSVVFWFPVPEIVVSMGQTIDFLDEQFPSGRGREDFLGLSLVFLFLFLLCF